MIEIIISENDYNDGRPFTRYSNLTILLTDFSMITHCISDRCDSFNIVCLCVSVPCHSPDQTNTCMDMDFSMDIT